MTPELKALCDLMPNLENPDEELANFLSEWLNDNAPLGWRFYLACAKDLRMKYCVKPREAATHD